MAISPPQSSGSVRSSGRYWVSMSTKVSASSVHRSAQAATPCAVAPKRQIATAASMPPSSSTSGYRAEIRTLQARQRPDSASHETSGMFSTALIRWPQAGQAERGTTRL